MPQAALQADGAPHDEAAAPQQHDQRGDPALDTQEHEGQNAAGREIRADLVLTQTARQINLDITVTSATGRQAMLRNQAAIQNGLAASLAERGKRSHYRPYLVTPLAMEIHGRLGDSALDFLQQLAQQTPAESRAEATYHLLRKLSATLQRHNANIIAGYMTDN